MKIGFAKAVMGMDGTEENYAIFNAIKKYYSNFDKLSEEVADWYCIEKTSKKNNSNEGKKTNRKNLFGIGEDKIYGACVRKALLSNKIKFKNKSKMNDAIEKYCKDLVNEEKDDEFKKWIIDYNISYLGILDSYFYSIIYPKYLGPQNFWKVVYSYTTAYLYLVGQLLNNSNENCSKIKETEEYYAELLEDPSDTIEKINRI